MNFTRINLLETAANVHLSLNPAKTFMLNKGKASSLFQFQHCFFSHLRQFRQIFDNTKFCQRHSRVGCSLSLTTVHSSFTTVHYIFILVQKTGMKKTVKQTSDVMSYDYAPSCRTTIGAHVVRS